MMTRRCVSKSGSPSASSLDTGMFIDVPASPVDGPSSINAQLPGLPQKQIMPSIKRPPQKLMSTTNMTPVPSAAPVRGEWSSACLPSKGIVESLVAPEQFNTLRVSKECLSSTSTSSYSNVTQLSSTTAGSANRGTQGRAAVTEPSALQGILPPCELSSRMVNLGSTLGGSLLGSNNTNSYIEDLDGIPLLPASLRQNTHSWCSALKYAATHYKVSDKQIVVRASTKGVTHDVAAPETAADEAKDTEESIRALFNATSTQLGPVYSTHTPGSLFTNPHQPELTKREVCHVIAPDNASEYVEELTSQLELLCSLADAHSAGFALWEHVFPQTKEGVVRVNERGKYVVRCFVNGDWAAVTIDDRVPLGADGRTLFPMSSTTGEIWPLLLCKAYLKASRGVHMDIKDQPLVQMFTGWTSVATTGIRLGGLPALVAAAQEEGSWVQATDLFLNTWIAELACHDDSRSQDGEYSTSTSMPVVCAVAHQSERIAIAEQPTNVPFETQEKALSTYTYVVTLPPSCYEEEGADFLQHAVQGRAKTFKSGGRRPISGGNSTGGGRERKSSTSTSTASLPKLAASAASVLDVDVSELVSFLLSDDFKVQVTEVHSRATFVVSALQAEKLFPNLCLIVNPYAHRYQRRIVETCTDARRAFTPFPFTWLLTPKRTQLPVTLHFTLEAVTPAIPTHNNLQAVASASADLAAVVCGGLSENPMNIALSIELDAPLGTQGQVLVGEDRTIHTHISQYHHQEQLSRCNRFTVTVTLPRAEQSSLLKVCVKAPYGYILHVFGNIGNITDVLPTQTRRLLTIHSTMMKMTALRMQCLFKLSQQITQGTNAYYAAVENKINNSPKDEAKVTVDVKLEQLMGAMKLGNPPTHVSNDDLSVHVRRHLLEFLYNTNNVHANYSLLPATHIPLKWSEPDAANLPPIVTQSIPESFCRRVTVSIGELFYRHPTMVQLFEALSGAGATTVTGNMYTAVLDTLNTAFFVDSRILDVRAKFALRNSTPAARGPISTPNNTQRPRPGSSNRGKPNPASSPNSVSSTTDPVGFLEQLQENIALLSSYMPHLTTLFKRTHADRLQHFAVRCPPKLPLSPSTLSACAAFTSSYATDESCDITDTVYIEHPLYGTGQALISHYSQRGCVFGQDIRPSIRSACSSETAAELIENVSSETHPTVHSMFGTYSIQPPYTWVPIGRWWFDLPSATKQSVSTLAPVSAESDDTQNQAAHTMTSAAAAQSAFQTQLGAFNAEIGKKVSTLRKDALVPTSHEFVFTLHIPCPIVGRYAQLHVIDLDTSETVPILTKLDCTGVLQSDPFFLAPNLLGYSLLLSCSLRDLPAPQVGTLSGRWALRVVHSGVHPLSEFRQWLPSLEGKGAPSNAGNNRNVGLFALAQQQTAVAPSVQSLVESGAAGNSKPGKDGLRAERDVNLHINDFTGTYTPNHARQLFSCLQTSATLLTPISLVVSANLIEEGVLMHASSGAAAFLFDSSCGESPVLQLLTKFLLTFQSTSNISSIEELIDGQLDCPYCNCAMATQPWYCHKALTGEDPLEPFHFDRTAQPCVCQDLYFLACSHTYASSALHCALQVSVFHVDELPTGEYIYKHNPSSMLTKCGIASVIIPEVYISKESRLVLRASLLPHCLQQHLSAAVFRLSNNYKLINEAAPVVHATSSEETPSQPTTPVISNAHSFQIPSSSFVYDTSYRQNVIVGVPTKPGNSQIAKATAVPQLAYPGRAAIEPVVEDSLYMRWYVRVTSNAPIALAHEQSLEDELAALRLAWEKGQPGRAKRAKALRERLDLEGFFNVDTICAEVADFPQHVMSSSRKLGQLPGVPDFIPASRYERPQVSAPLISNAEYAIQDAEQGEYSDVVSNTSCISSDFTRDIYTVPHVRSLQDIVAIASQSVSSGIQTPGLAVTWAREQYTLMYPDSSSFPPELCTMSWLQNATSLIHIQSALHTSCAKYLSLAHHNVLVQYLSEWRYNYARQNALLLTKVNTLSVYRSKQLNALHELQNSLCASVLEGGRDVVSGKSKHVHKKSSAAASSASAYLQDVLAALGGVLELVRDDEEQQHVDILMRIIESTPPMLDTGKKEKEKEKDEEEEKTQLSLDSIAPLVLVTVNRVKQLGVLALTALVMAEGPNDDLRGSLEAEMDALARFATFRNSKMLTEEHFSADEIYVLKDLRLLSPASLTPERVTSIVTLCTTLYALPLCMKSKLLVCLLIRVERLLCMYYFNSLETKFQAIRDNAKGSKQEDLGALLAETENQRWRRFLSTEQSHVIASIHAYLADLNKGSGAGKRAAINSGRGKTFKT